MKNLKSMLMVILLITAVISVHETKAEVNIDLIGGDGGFVYYYGQRVDMNINLSQPSYLIVYAVNLDGDIRIVFPNADIRNNYVNSGSTSVSRNLELLADIEGPMFMVAIASTDRKLSFMYQDRNVPLWSPHWGEYHPTYSFISDVGFGRENNFPIVLARRSPRFYNRRLINDFEFNRLTEELNDKIERDFKNFDRIIDYFIADMNEAVTYLDIEFTSQSKELYIASSRYNSEIYEQRGTSVGQTSGYESSRGDSYYPESYGSDVNINLNFNLDPYGYWVYIDGYRVWRPYVGFGWRPFYHGYWRWSYRGWIWICYEPWHMAYYYGYWHYHWRYGWVWIPGYTWHPPHVVFYYYHGYTGWRPAPVPQHVYSSNVRPRTHSYTTHTYNQYVFVSSSDFTAMDISSRALPEDVFNSTILPNLDSRDMMKYDDHARFYNDIKAKENLTIKEVDLEKTTFKADDGSQFETLMPKLDSREKEAINAKSRDLMNEIRDERQIRGDAVRESAITDRSTPAVDQSRSITRDRDSSIQKREVQRDRSQETPSTGVTRPDRQIIERDSSSNRTRTSPGETTRERTPDATDTTRSRQGDSSQISTIDRSRERSTPPSSTTTRGRTISRPSTTSRQPVTTKPSAPAPSSETRRPAAKPSGDTQKSETSRATTSTTRSGSGTSRSRTTTSATTSTSDKDNKTNTDSNKNNDNKKD